MTSDIVYKNGVSKSHSATQWKYLNKAGFSPRPLRVAIAGAGASGICLAIKILEAQSTSRLGTIELTIYEREDDYGGTWYVNRYPGCRCDIPSHVYTFSFAPYSDWTQFYSSAPEINKYMHLVAQKYGVEPYIKLGHTLTGAHFNEQTSSWTLAVRPSSGAEFSHEVDVYIPATGVLSQVNRPNIRGIETFTKSPIIHTAEWPRTLDFKTEFKNERVAVIGIGSSGVQTIGAIAPFCKSVDIYARSKFWVSPPFMTEPAGKRDWVLGNFDYPESEKELYRNDPEAFYKHCSALSAATMHLFDIFFRGSPSQEAVKDIVRQQMISDLKGDEELISKLIPDWDVWCRRVTPCATFMHSLHMPHVTLDTDPISEITPEGIKTMSGKVTELDRIILATGFDTSFRPKYDIFARGSLLADVWGSRAKSYMSIAVAGFPNLFFMCGPGTVFANGSLLAGIESNAKYIVEALVKIQTQDIKSMEISQDAQDEYNAQQEAVMKDLVFSDACSSWYKAGDPNGVPDALFAGSTLQFMELLERPRWEDWKFVPAHANRFSFLGNGTGTIEATGGDRAWYLKEADHVNPLHAKA
ncbi:cyclohexanone monooxygenase [Meredithblackwellia eburnea MCA 4105]